MPLDAFSPSVPFKQKLLQMLDLHRAECSLDYTSPRKSAKVTERTQPFCSHKSCLNTLPAWAILLALIKQQGKLLLWQRTKSVWTVVRLWKVWAIMTLPPTPTPLHPPPFTIIQKHSHQKQKCHPYTIAIRCWSVDNEVTGHRVLIDAPCVRSSQDWCILVAEHVDCQPQLTNVVGEGIIVCFDQQLEWGRNKREHYGLFFVVVYFVFWLAFVWNQQTKGSNGSWHTSFFHPSHYAKMRCMNLMPTKSGINVVYAAPPPPPPRTCQISRSFFSCGQQTGR